MDRRQSPNSADLDAVMDKIAEHHTDAALDVTYNTSGKNAMKSAIDCIFDAEHLTLSSVWLNEHESEVAMRAYTMVEFNSGGSPVREYAFHQMITDSTPYVFWFKVVSGATSGGCGADLDAAAMTNSDDWVGDFGTQAQTTRCGSSPTCSAYPPPRCTAPSRNCLCTDPDDDPCDKVDQNVTGSNGAITRLDP